MIIYDNYYIPYSYINYNHSDLKVKIDSAVCFNSLFKSIGPEHNNIKATLKLYKNSRNNNHVFLSEEEMIEFIEYCKSIVNFEYNLVRNVNMFLLTIHCKDHYKNEIKFIFTALRKLYEYPYSITIKDFLRLRSKNTLKISDFSLFLLLDFACTDTIHGLINSRMWYNRITVKQYQKKLKDNSYIYLQNITSGSYNDLSIDYFMDFSDRINTSSETTEEMFKTRIKIYKTLQDLIKKHRMIKIKKNRKK